VGADVVVATRASLILRARSLCVGGRIARASRWGWVRSRGAAMRRLRDERLHACSSCSTLPMCLPLSTWTISRLPARYLPADSGRSLRAASARRSTRGPGSRASFAAEVVDVGRCARQHRACSRRARPDKKAGRAASRAPEARASMIADSWITQSGHRLRSIAATQLRRARRWGHPRRLRVGWASIRAS
jgi:hypothetical protein